MGSKITYGTIESQAYSNIFEVLDNRSYVVDPRDPGARKLRKFVYDSDPFIDSLNSDLMPYIVLSLPVASAAEDQVLDTKSGRVSWTHEITVVTTRYGSSNSTIDVGKTDMLNICDDIIQTFNSKTVRDSLRALEIAFVRIRKTGTDVTTINGKDVYTSAFELSYQRRITISS